MAPEKRVVIIGAGIGGITAAISLKTKQWDLQILVQVHASCSGRALPNATAQIYEKGDGVGGTWKSTHTRDIPIHYYSLSSEMRFDWPNIRATQPEILEYWQSLAKKHDLHPKIQYSTRVISATWDVELQQYTIITEDVITGVRAETTAHVVISAVGFLDIPSYPVIKGLASFKGPVFHSAAWDHSVDLTRKRVAVVGNGASAAQLLPIISKDRTTQVTNFCRTPVWYVNSPNKPISPNMKWVFRYIPLASRLFRSYHYAWIDTLFFLLKSARLAENCKKWIQSRAPEEYSDWLMPNYPIGCRRITVGGDFLDALHRENVSLNWDGIEEITGNEVTTQQGKYNSCKTMAFDGLIFATGFVTNDYPITIRGKKETLQEYKSKGGPTAYIGTTFPTFPNFYMLGGPNTIRGSIVFIEECQVAYSLQLIKPVLESRVSSYAVTTKAADDYDVTLQARMRDSVYVNCLSWYRVGGNGRVSMPWPAPVTVLWWLLRKVDWRDYEAIKN